MEDFLLLIFWIVVGAGIWYFFRLRGKSKGQIELGGNSVDRIIKNSEELISTNLTRIKKTAQRSIGKS